MRQGGQAKRILFIIKILLGAGFLLARFSWAADSSVTINELAWMGTETSSSDEWIELYNNTDQDIDLNGWILLAQDGSPEIILTGSILSKNFFLLERTNDDSVPGITADQIYTGALGNNGEILELRDQDNNLIDILNLSDGWPAGDNSTKQTMEKNNNTWQTSLNPGGTPKANNSSGTENNEETETPICGNDLLEDGEDCDDGNTINNDGCDANCKIETPEETNDEENETDDSKKEQAEKGSSQKIYHLGNVLISEFVSDPADNDTEWIELYNNTFLTIDLTDWSIEDGSGAITKLNGSLETFRVIENPKGKLNNPGDIIILRDAQDNLIDQVAYGNWNDNQTNNAPVTSDPWSVARPIENYNTFNNANDFVVTTKTTKGKSNIIATPPNEQEITPEEKANFDYSNKIKITEIFPNPSGPDNENEFIEIANFDTKEINLEGWKLTDESAKNFILKNTIIKPGEYKIFTRPETSLALNNHIETIKLFPPLTDQAQQTVSYKTAIENWSYNFKEAKLPIGSLASNNNWVWSETPTPGEANKIQEINRPPIVEFYCPDKALVATPIYFDSSDTNDDNEADLKFAWNFGDDFSNNLPNPEHTYLKTGNYTVKLTVDDGVNQTEKEKIIIITDDLESASTTVLGYMAEYSPVLIINEIMPSPEGSDEDNEWIEIFNSGDTKINLLNWRVDDSENGSSPYEFLDDTWLNAQSYFVMDRPTTKISLNNDFDTVRLFHQEELIDQIDYQNAPEGEALARGQNNKWFWTTTPTPLEKNIITLSEGEFVLDYETLLKTNSQTNVSILPVPLEKIPEQTKGTKIITQGTVAVLPGTFASQYFYITGSAGVQVYSYKKDFPKLRIGDLIEVTGELSQVNNEWRIKTKTAADIRILDKNISLPPTSKTCAEIYECAIGELLQITGEVVEQKGSSLFLDDGTDEVLVYLKTNTGINPKDYKPGKTISVAGLLTNTQSGPRLMPRSPDDITIKDAETNTTQPIGEISTEVVWELAARDKKLELFKYLLIIASGIILLLIGLLIKTSSKAH